MTDMEGITRVHVRELPLLADIGINPDEIGRRQPLIVSVDLAIAAGKVERISETVDYRKIASAAEGLAALHVPLIETFAWRLAEICLSFPATLEVSVRIDKPFALARGLAGTEVTLKPAPSEARGRRS